jgi:O-antigen/teichoic acid export membrane protein
VLSRSASSILRNSAFLLGSQGIAMLVRSGYAVAVALVLGPELYGLFYYGIAWYLAILSITVLGLPVILARGMFGAGAESGARLIPTTLVLRVVVAAVAAVGSGLAAFAVEHDSHVRIMLVAFSLALFARSLALWAKSVFVTLERADLWMRQEATYRSVEAVVGLVALGLGGGVVTLSLVHAGAWWLEAGSCWRAVRRYHWASGWAAEWRWLPRLLRQGVQIGLMNFMSTVFCQAPMIVMRHLEGQAASLGYLALALQALSILGQLPRALAAAALPVLSRASRAGERLYVTTALRLGILSGGLVGLVGMTVLPALAASELTARYGELLRLLPVALWLAGPLGCASVLHYVLLVRGLDREAGISVAAGALLTGVLLLSEVREGGAVVALAASGVGLLVWAGAALAFCSTRLSIPLLRSGVLPAACVAVAAGSAWAVRPLSPLLALAIGVTVLGSSAWSLGVLSTDERRTWARVLVRFRGRRSDG